MAFQDLRKFEKNFLNAEEHIALIRSRNLLIEDEAFAKHWLESVGYYRLTGYGLHFRERNADNTLSEQFKAGTKFEDFVKLHEFDRCLRLLILDAVERFEVAFRTRLNNTMASRHGPHWFMNAALFSQKRDASGNLLFNPGEFLEATKRHQQSPFIKKYFETYEAPPHPPCWMLAEIITLGIWSRAYGMLAHNQDRKPTADRFRLSVKEMASFSQAITDLRNKCAHQSRVWDGHFVSGPRLKGNLKKVTTGNTRLFAQVAALMYCLWTIEPKTQWLNRLEALILCHPVDLNVMGFPENWYDTLLSLRN